MTDFVHLHVHSEYSLLDGACRIDRLIEKAKATGQSAVALTDHGVMYGAVEFYKKAKATGIKPIIGCEVYVAPRSRFDKIKELDGEYRHLILLCKNDTGYRNLITLVSRGFTEGFYSKPRIDEELLFSHTEGLVALSACLSGEVPKRLLAGDYNGAKETAIRYNEAFGNGNYYLELQNHGLEDEQRVMPQLIRIAKETGIPTVAANDAHYIDKEDSEVQNILICIGTNHTVNEKNALGFESDEFYLKTGDEMAEIFPAEAIENTVKIAEKCNFDFEFGKIKLPFFDIGDRDHTEYFRELCFRGARRIYGENLPKEVSERLDYELSVISSMGYVDYYLIVADFVNHAKDNGIPVGPGRGSGAASLAAYCIGITGIDPLRYDLIFERFLNPERVSMPDFDIDFCYIRRQEVIDYVIRRYGTDHVAQIVTFGTMAARAAVRDVGRAMDIPYAVCDRIAKLIPQELKVTIDSALNKVSELKAEYEGDETVKKLIDTARKVEGMPRHASTHAAGVVITDKPVGYYVPLSTNDGAVVTQYTMTALDELGLLKMDFLGLRNLTVIDDTLQSLKKEGISLTLSDIPTDDKETMAMMSKGKTEGVFQFESAGMKACLQQLKPERLEDLIATIALYRPGPMESIPKYIENRHNADKIKYKTELLRPILSVTYGCIVYQEQVMQIFRSLAGYSLGRADIVRRAVSKKKKDVLLKERNAFIYGEKDENGNVICDGCINRGIDEQTAKEIFDEMSAFSSYAFNKSHAAAYAYVSYITAYLKCRYEKQYMAALLTSVLDMGVKLAGYIADCRDDGINILPPDVNESGKSFTPTENGIRFGLLAIRNIGGNLVDLIVKERENGKFTSVYDFLYRLYGFDLNRRAVESLIKSGALDGFGNTRRALLQAAEPMLRAIENEKKYVGNGQMDLFGESEMPSGEKVYDIPDTPEMPEFELLAGEKEVTGMYISGHPITAYPDAVKGAGLIKSYVINDTEANKKYDGKRVCFAGMIGKVRKKETKNEQVMAFLECEDMFGSVNVIVFPKLYTEYSGSFTVGAVFKFSGRLSVKENGEADIILEKAAELVKGRLSRENAGAQNSSGENVSGKKYRKGLYLRVTSSQSAEFIKCREILNGSKGKTPVIVKETESGRAYIVPESEWVSVNDGILSKLSEILGNENVKYIE